MMEKEEGVEKKGNVHSKLQHVTWCAWTQCHALHKRDLCNFFFSVVVLCPPTSDTLV